MALITQTPNLQAHETVELPTYLENIVHKKVSNVALSCFECLVHWFLTAFSCFYGAYNQFYQRELSRISSLENEDLSVPPTPYKGANTIDLSVPPAPCKSANTIDLSVPPTPYKGANAIDLSVPPTPYKGANTMDLSVPPPAYEDPIVVTASPPPYAEKETSVKNTADFEEVPGPSPLPQKIKRTRHQKLIDQYNTCQAQAKTQTLGEDFSLKLVPSAFEAEAFEVRVANYEVGICSYQGRRPHMEDEHATASFDLHVGDKIFPVQLFGVFDGHGGRGAASYVKKNIENRIHETINEFCSETLSEDNIYNALKEAFIRLDREFKGSSGTTATVVIFLDGNLWTVHSGDSRAILSDGVQLSEDAKPEDPRYAKGIVKRGGSVYFGRINGNLAVARAIGDHDVVGVSPNPTITVIPIPQNLNLIIACDGIFDVVSTRELAHRIEIRRKLPGKLSTVKDLAHRIVYSAYEASSTDNLTAIVVKL